jgi:hypothetical protein
MSQGRKRYGRASGRFGEAVGYIKEFWRTKRDLGKHYICYGSVMLELTLNCLANSCKTTFDSSIDEIPSILLELSFVS